MFLKCTLKLRRRPRDTCVLICSSSVLRSPGVVHVTLDLTETGQQRQQWQQQQQYLNLSADDIAREYTQNITFRGADVAIAGDMPPPKAAARRRFFNSHVSESPKLRVV